MEMYHFVTKWFFNAPIEKVWKEIEDVESWPTWWQDWRKTAIRGPESKAQLGSVVDCAVRGSLPYTLRFSMEITSLEPPTLSECESSGDLAGSGKWVLEAQNDGTAVTYYWDVGTTNPIFNILGKLSFVRAMMEKNHNEVMASGHHGLESWLER